MKLREIMLASDDERVALAITTSAPSRYEVALHDLLYAEPCGAPFQAEARDSSNLPVSAMPAFLCFCFIFKQRWGKRL